MHYPETLNKAYSGIRNVETIINGHSNTTMTWPDVKTFADFNQDFLTWAQAALKSGKPMKDAAAEWKPPAKYDALGYSNQVGALFGGVEGRLNRLATEMK
jgi:hypothetical protein